MDTPTPAPTPTPRIRRSDSVENFVNPDAGEVDRPIPNRDGIVAPKPSEKPASADQYSSR